MPKKKMMVEWDDDAQLSESRKKPGQKSPLTRDANNKLSHVTLSEVPDDESTSNSDPIFIYVTDPHESETPSREEVRMEMAVAAARLVIEKAPEWAPVLQRFWIEQGAPRVQSTWNRRPRPRVLRKRSRELRSAVPVDTDAVDGDEVVVSEVEAPRISMSREEANARHDAALAAIRFSEAQFEILRGARIIDDELPEVEGAIDSLPTLSAGDSIQPSIESAPRVLDEGLVGISLSEAGSADMDHARVPVKPAKVKRVLRQRRVR